MNITKDCVECIVGQIDKALLLLNIEKNQAKTIQKEVLEKSKSFCFDKTPPYTARGVYEYLAKEINSKDPLEKLKQQSIQTAIKFLPFINEKIEKSQDKLFTAIKASVAGNVIDFGAKEQFSLEDEINKVFETDFSINDYEKLKEEIEKNSSILILADNAGENVFDKVLIQTIKQLYPNKDIMYATRGKPIINDITTKEALQIEIDKYATVVSSGVDTPGCELSRVSKEFLEIFNNTQVIISKGMGNYECLESCNDNRIFFIFKVKCNVVANSINKAIGDIILKKG